MKILIDECLPRYLKQVLVEFEGVLNAALERAVPGVCLEL